MEGDTVCVAVKFAALHRSLRFDFRTVSIASVLTRKERHPRTCSTHAQYVLKQTHTLTITAREREGVSCTCCECLGARWCYWFSGRHGNPHHLSASAAERLRRTHTHHMNARTLTYSYIFPPRHLSVTSLSPPSSSPLVFLSSSHSCLHFLLTSLLIRLFSQLNLRRLFTSHPLPPLLILFSSFPVLLCHSFPFLS